MEKHQFSRTEMLIGTKALDKLQRSRVMIFGIGGVGGYVCEALARSGIGEIHIVDNDIVSLTNLNRQIYALHSTLGMAKVDVAEKRILDINPYCKVEKYKMFYLPENADDVDLSAMDYVIDCIDTVKAKLELARRCHRLGIRFISSMGAANKMNPDGFRVLDIQKTQMDPLAKVIRKKLRHEGINHLKVVCSEEQPVDIAKIAQMNVKETCSDVAESSIFYVNGGIEGGDLQTIALREANSNGGSRRQVPASNAFVPAAAGLLLASEVVKDLIKIF